MNTAHEPATDLDQLGDEIAELSAHLDAATARLLDLIREFDSRGGWNTVFCSCAAWLSWRVGLDPGAARERVRVARALGTLPRLARVDRQAEAQETARRHAGRALHVYQDEDGTVLVRGRLAPEVGALLMRALDAARETLYQRSRERSREGAGDTMAENVSDVSAETSRRLACDASRVVMRHDAHGRVVEVGARTRTIPPALRRALHHRDRGCRFPGCGLAVGQGHHIRHWAHGGPTTLSNLALLCRRHHRAVHEEGYQVDREPDGTLSFRRPDGELLPAVPSPAPVAANPVKVLRERHEARGLHVRAQTAMPGWLGERLDVGWAIDVLHPLAAGVGARCRCRRGRPRPSRSSAGCARCSRRMRGSLDRGPGFEEAEARWRSATRSSPEP